MTDGGEGDGIPITAVIAGFYGITIEQAEEYWNSKVAEAKTARAELPSPQTRRGGLSRMTVRTFDITAENITHEYRADSDEAYILIGDGVRLSVSTKDDDRALTFNSLSSLVTVCRRLESALRPLLSWDDRQLQPMVLVIPPALGEAETLRTLAKAVQDARNTLAFKAENLKKAADEAEAKGDHKRMELARNLLMANSKMELSQGAAASPAGGFGSGRVMGCCQAALVRVTFWPVRCSSWRTRSRSRRRLLILES